MCVLHTALCTTLKLWMNDTFLHIFLSISSLNQINLSISGLPQRGLQDSDAGLREPCCSERRGILVFAELRCEGSHGGTREGAPELDKPRRQGSRRQCPFIKLEFQASYAGRRPSLPVSRSNRSRLNVYDHDRVRKEEHTQEAKVRSPSADLRF